MLQDISDKPGPSEVAFVQYWHDPEGEFDDGFYATIGLAEERLAMLKPDLNEALVHGCALEVRASGGFSTVDPNRYSKQPTLEKFQLGLPLRLSDVTLHVLAPWARLPSTSQ